MVMDIWSEEDDRTGPYDRSEEERWVGEREWHSEMSWVWQPSTQTLRQTTKQRKTAASTCQKGEKKNHMNRLRIPTLWGDYVGRRRRMYRISAPAHSFSLFFFRHHCWGSDLMQTSAISPRIIRQTMTNTPESTFSESSGLWEVDQKFELFYLAGREAVVMVNCVVILLLGWITCSSAIYVPNRAGTAVSLPI